MLNESSQAVHSCGLMQKDDIRQYATGRNREGDGCGLMQKDDIRQCGSKAHSDTKVVV